MNALQTFLKRNWLWVVVNFGILVVVVWTVILVIQAPQVDGSGTLMSMSSKPTRHIVLFSGKTALVLLVLSLACTPLARLLDWRAAISVRKSLGLWGFAFALFHGLMFMGGTALFVEPAAWRKLAAWYPVIFIPTQTKSPYAAYGAVALCLLLPLVITSNRWSMRRLGKGWKRLHRLVYLVVPLALFHYWRRDVMLNHLSNDDVADHGQLLLFALAIGLLLLLRIPMVRQSLRRLMPRPRFP